MAKEKEPGKAKVLRCGELGMKCNFEAMGDSEEEVLEKMEKHLRYDHDIHGPEKWVDACRTRLRDTQREEI